MGVDGDGEGWEGGVAVCAGVQRGCDDEERWSVVVGNRVVCHGRTREGRWLGGWVGGYCLRSLWHSLSPSSERPSSRMSPFSFCPSLGVPCVPPRASLPQPAYGPDSVGLHCALAAHCSLCHHHPALPLTQRRFGDTHVAIRPPCCPSSTRHMPARTLFPSSLSAGLSPALQPMQPTCPLLIPDPPRASPRSRHSSCICFHACTLACTLSECSPVVPMHPESLPELGRAVAGLFMCHAP